MAQFTYKAVNADKKVIHGQIAAKSREEAAHLVSQQGYAPLVIHEETEKAAIKGTVPMIEKITFCRYLSVMMTTGLSLSEGIDVLRRETKNPLMVRILSDMSYNLEQGQQLSTIFERYPGVFESYFLTLTKAGEMSGKLSDVFKYLESELRAEYSLNTKVKGALMYPAIVFTAMIGIGIMMFFFILPQIGKVFLNMNMTLPVFTKFLFTTSIWFNKQMVPIFIGSSIFVAIGFFLFQKKQVRDFLSLFIRPIPIIKNLIMKIDLARFCRIFSTLIRSAVPITDALEISLSTLSWYQYRELAKILPDEVKKGRSLSDLIRDNGVFPSLMVQMIAAGEKTGTLDATLADMATFYEQEVEEEVKSLTQIIEPVLMLCVGIGVGAMILSIIGPIYSVVGNFQSAAGAPPR